MKSKAIDCIEKLMKLNFKIKEAIPLSPNELYETKHNISENLDLFEALKNFSIISEAKYPLEIVFYTGKNRDILNRITEQSFGDTTVYIVESGDLGRLIIKNTAPYKVYVYMLKIDSEGRLTSGRIWENHTLINEGIKPQETQASYTFVLNDPAGICERHIISCASEIPYLSAPSPFSNIDLRSLSPDFSLVKLKKQIVRYRIIQSFIVV